ncbi:hypothetical protein Hanom_Chr13g01201411 [Helianthus anomalus]
MNYLPIVSKHQRQLLTVYSDIRPWGMGLGLGRGLGENAQGAIQGAWVGTWVLGVVPLA